jgi:hypothetical protein
LVDTNDIVQEEWLNEFDDDVSEVGAAIGYYLKLLLSTFGTG